VRVAARARVHLTTLPPQVRPWNGGTTRDRRDGEYYGAMWQGTTNLKPYSLKIWSVKPLCEVSMVFLDFAPAHPLLRPLTKPRYQPHRPLQPRSARTLRLSRSRPSMSGMKGRS